MACGVSTAWLRALVVAAALAAARGLGSWKDGRATMYGSDAWSIHKGSCGYGYISPDGPLGWDVAAMPDVADGYADSCGSCYEVACDPSTFKDGYGETLDRTQACLDSGASVVFRITDTCPCVYPSNSYSNKRWCCGDMPHFDLSVWGFERLASTKWGVIGIRFRQVPCDYKPSKLAPPVSNPTPGEQPPAGANLNAVRDWPDVSNTITTPAYDGGMKGGWRDGSYNVKPASTWMGSVMGSGRPLCMSTQPKGAIVFKTNKGAFENHVALELWMYQGQAQQVDKGIVVVVGGDSGDCTPVDLHDITPTGFKPRCTTCTEYWWKFEVYMSAFSGYGADTLINDAKYFKGCGGNAVEGLYYVEVRNYKPDAQTMCVDHVQLV